jgi:hypothetical protein
MRVEQYLLRRTAIIQTGWQVDEVATQRFEGVLHVAARGVAGEVAVFGLRDVRQPVLVNAVTVPQARGLVARRGGFAVGGAVGPVFLRLRSDVSDVGPVAARRRPSRAQLPAGDELFAGAIQIGKTFLRGQDRAIDVWVIDGTASAENILT